MVKVIENIKNTTYDIKWIKEKFEEDLLTINNDYQRRFVWTDKDKIKLIETILLGYSVPEIYLHEKGTDPDSGATNFDIVDGQQRITSIVQFINEEFNLDYKEINENFRGKYFKDLNAEDKSNIWKYPFSVRVISANVSEDDIKQLFLRLNATDKSLNPQELRNASFSGKFLKLAEVISENDFWEKVYRSKVYVRRMQDIKFISEILVYLRYGIVTSSNANLNKAYDDYNNEYREYEIDKKRFEEMIGLVSELAANSDAISEAITKPVHLYSIFIISDFILDDRNKIESYKAGLISFYEEYYNDDKKSLIVENYYENSQEGTGSKMKRVKRNTLLKEYLNNYIN